MAVNVLGSLDVGDVALRPQECLLLGALVLRHGSVVTPDQLADACWGESPPSTWKQQLKTSVGRIRRSLGSGAVVTRPQGYSFGWESESIDTVRFERLVAGGREYALRGEDDRAVHAFDLALGLWRGTAFSDLVDWRPALVESERLAEIRATVEEEYIAARLRLGHAADVIPDAERLVRQEPLREGRWRLLALANYQSDRQAEALAVLRAGRARLQDELGIDPSVLHNELEAAILRHGPEVAAPVQQNMPSEVCPYRGLRAFDAGDAEIFFGRDREIDVLLGRIIPGSITTVTGPSGSGKSSLVSAGVLPRIDIGDRLSCLIRPEASGLATLRTWRESLKSTDVIVVDQFEELWGNDGEFIDTFCAALRLVLDRGVAVIVTIRSDFLDRATSLPHVGEDIGRSVFAVGPLTSAAVRAAIEQPAKLAGLRVEPGLTQLMVRECGGISTALPYLSHALSETWARREGTTLTVAGYTASGGIVGAIAQSAEELYEQLTLTDRDLLQSVVLRLVERTLEGASVRRQAEMAPLVEDPQRQRIIDRLVSARLVSIDGSRIVLTHEAIAEAWPRLDEWLQDDAVSNRMLRELQVSAARWDQAGRTDDELARGVRMRAYLASAESRESELTSVERDFLDASEVRARGELAALRAQAALDRRRVRGLRWALAGVAALLVVALVSVGFASLRERDAVAAENDARTVAVAAGARSLIGSDRDVSALLAAELYRRDPTDLRARSALLAVLEEPSTPTTKVTFADSKKIAAAALPGTTTMLVVADPTSANPAKDTAPRVEVWDVTKATRVRSVKAKLPINETNGERFVFVDPQGNRAVIVTPTWDHGISGDCCLSTISSIDLHTGANIATDKQLPFEVAEESAMFPDGSELALLDVRTGEPIWVDTATLSTATISRPSEYGSPVVSHAISVLKSGEVAVGRPMKGGLGAIYLYDAASHSRERTIPLPADLASWSLSTASNETVLTSGPDGIALVDTNAGTILWQHKQMSNSPCITVRASPLTGTALCRADTVRELAMTDGAPTGRTFDSQSVWDVNFDLLSDGSLALVNLQSPPFVQRFPLDGTGPISTLIARDQQVAGDFLDKSTIVTTPIERSDKSLSQSMTRWDIRHDRALPNEPGELYVVGQGVVHRWSEHEAATVLTDVANSGDWNFPADFDEPGDGLVPVDGGAGARSFAIADDWIVPFDPLSGHTTGPPLDFAGKQFHWRWVMVHEVPGDRAVVTWWDKDDVDTVTALFDLKTGAELARGLRGEVATIPLADGDLLSVSSSGLRRNSMNLEPKSVLSKPVSEANVFELSDDGSTLLLDSWGGDAALYDTASSTKIGSDISVVSPDWESAHLSPDGLALVTNAPNGVLLWDLHPSAMFDAACRLAGRALTATEWTTYFPGEPYVNACHGKN
jgi:DNA-binding SARP family transcriptional activator